MKTRYEREDGTVGEVVKANPRIIKSCKHELRPRIDYSRSVWHKDKWSNVCIKCGVCR